MLAAATRGVEDRWEERRALLEEDEQQYHTPEEGKNT